MAAGPFLPGQKLKAGQLNDATQKTVDSLAVGISGAIVSGITTETNIPQLALGPVDLAAGGLYSFNPSLILQNSVSTDEFAFRVRRDTPVTGTLVAELEIFRPLHTLGYEFESYALASFLATESNISFYCSLARTNGTGNITIYGLFGGLARTQMSMVRVGYGSAFRVVT